MRMNEDFFCKAVIVLLTLSIILCHDLKNLSHVFSGFAILCFLIWLYQKDFRPIKTISSDVWMPLVVFAFFLLPGMIFAHHLDSAIHTYTEYILFWPLHGLMAYCMLKEDITNIKICLTTYIFLCIEGLYVCYEFITGINMRSGGFIGGYYNLFCIMLIVHFVICHVILYEDFFTQKQRIVAGFVELILILSIFSNGSRGGYLTCAVFLLVNAILYLRKYFQKSVTILCGFLIVVSVFALSPYVRNRVISIVNTTTCVSNTSRLNAWEHIWFIVKDKPFCGMGLGNWKRDYYSTLGKTVRAGNEVLSHAHNNIAQMAVEGGYPAAIGYIFMMGSFAWMGLQKYYKNGNPYGMMIFYVIFVLNLYGMVDWTFGWHYTAKTFFFVLGCLLSLKENYNRTYQKSE